MKYTVPDQAIFQRIKLVEINFVLFLTKYNFCEKNSTITYYFQDTFEKGCIFALGLVVKGRLG